MSEHHLPPVIPENAVFTIGHSTLPMEQFITLLKKYYIQCLVDIRTIPRSRHNPQFNKDAMEEILPKAQIEYRHFKVLGGLRHPSADSPNAGWRNASFRGYADYMQTHAFQQALETLMQISREKRTALMCAEAVPWRCHRSLVADALNVRNVPVIEILPDNHYRMHKLTPFAQVSGTDLTYPPEQVNLL